MIVSPRPAAAWAAHLPSLAVAAAVAVLLLMPQASLPDAPSWLPSSWDAILDKLGHAGLFFVLAGLWYRSVLRLRKRSSPLALAVLAATAYGGLLELAQALTPTRDASLADAAADLAGALLFASCARLARAFLRLAPGADRRAGIRFTPPPVPLTPALFWMLARAFGPAAASAPSPGDPQAALALARRFALAARIAARSERGLLEREVGSAGAAELAADRRAAAANALRFEGTIGAVSAAAARAEIPVVFLKYAALELAGRLAAGARAASDVDVLAPAGREEELQRALSAAGFAATGSPGYEHQLPPLVHPRLGAVEVHRMIVGVRLDGRRSATFSALAAAGLLRPIVALPGRVSIPVSAVLAAHAAVHGLAQHGFEPAAYPFLRTVADLLDLALADDSPGHLLASAADWLCRDVSGEEIAALSRLLEELAAGRPRTDGADGASILLRHALAGRLDAAYERSLKLAFLAPRPSDRGDLSRLGRALGHALWLSNAQIDAVYGPPARRAGYWARRFARPFDLAGRWLRSLR